MASMSEREHLQGLRKQPRQMIVRKSKEEADAWVEAAAGVKFTMCKGVVLPEESKEFNAVFKRLWNKEITREQFDEWVTTFNNRPRGRQEFKI